MVVASSVRRAADMKEQSESRRSSFESGGGHAARKSLFKIPVPPCHGSRVVSSSSMKIKTKGDDDDETNDGDSSMDTSMDVSVVGGSKEGGSEEEEDYDSDRSR